MLDAVLELIPTARVGHIGLQRDEMTAVASQVLLEAAAGPERSVRPDDRPDAGDRRERRRGARSAPPAGARDVRMICIVAAPEGIALVEQHHPDVQIYTPVVDEGLNAHKFIVPGFGDFGDRLYGT